MAVSAVALLACPNFSKKIMAIDLAEVARRRGFTNVEDLENWMREQRAKLSHSDELRKRRLLGPRSDDLSPRLNAFPTRCSHSNDFCLGDHTTFDEFGHALVVSNFAPASTFGQSDDTRYRFLVHARSAPPTMAPPSPTAPLILFTPSTLSQAAGG